MTEVCIRIPEELRQNVQEFGIDFSVLVRRLLMQEMQKLSELRLIVSKSKFTERDVRELSDKIDKSLSQRFMQSIGK